MKTVNSTVTIDTVKLCKLTANAIRALEKTAEALHTEVVQAQVMPRDSGHLQNAATACDFTQAASGKVSLVSSTPYARRLYFHPEYRYRKTENPNAGGKWLEPWITGDRKDFCKQAFSAFFKEEGG